LISSVVYSYYVLNEKLNILKTTVSVSSNNFHSLSVKYLTLPILTYYFTLRRDNLPAVDVKTWYLHAHMFDGDIAPGPVPLLFAANPDEAAASIAAEPAKAHFDLSKVTFIILISLLTKYKILT
jgi:hypothetical protein